MLHGIMQQAESLPGDLPALHQVFGPVEHPLPPRRRVLCHALRIERANGARQCPAVRCRSGDRQRRIKGIDVDWRDVNLQPGMQLFRVNPKHAARTAQERNERKARMNPPRPLSLAQYPLLPVKIEARRGGGRIHVDPHGHAGSRVIHAQVVGRSRNAQVCPAIRVETDMHDAAARNVAALLSGLVGEERKCAECAQQVGSPHAGNRVTRFHRREVRRHPQYGDGYAVVRKDLPEWRSVTQIADSALGERQPVRSHRETVCHLRPFVPSRSTKTALRADDE